LSESHTDSPLPGGGRRIARASSDVDEEELAAKLAQETPTPPRTSNRSAHRAAGPPSTLSPDTPEGGHRRASAAVSEPGQAALPLTPTAGSSPLPPAPPVDKAPPPPTPPIETSREPDATPPFPPSTASTGSPAADLGLAAAAPGSPAAVGDDGAAATISAGLSAPVPSHEVVGRREPVRPETDPTPPVEPADETGSSYDVETAGEPVPPRAPTAWDAPIVTATRRATVDEAQPQESTAEQPAVETAPVTTSTGGRITAAVVVIGLAAAVVAGAQVAETEGWLDSVANSVVRTAALVSTWCAVVLLSRRCGGRTVIIGGFAAVVLGLAGAFPEAWALAGAAVTAGTVFGLLGMVYTRPARGAGLVRELAVSGLIGLAGALVVSGYHVELRPYRFRVMVLGLVLVGAFLLAWRLGNGARGIGRRGAALIVVGVVVLAGSLAYAQAIRSWGSPGLVQNLDDFKAWVTDLLGAAPRPVEALVGFPALVWGVAARLRRRQGWWMCAFGALGAAGVTSSLVYPGVDFWSAMESTGYDLVIGLVLGIVVVAVDRVLTAGGGGRRADSTRDVDPDRPEPPRFAPLL
jgi:hypothetical protein